MSAMTVEIAAGAAEGMRRPELTGLSLQITDACNLACSYCYFYDKSPIAMTEEIVDRSLDLLAGQAGVGTSSWHITLFGGEPTLRPRLIEYICTTATERGRAAGRD